MRRVLILSVVALGLSPGLFWREYPAAPDESQWIRAEALPVPQGATARIGGQHGPLLTGIWHLSSPNHRFGSYSALILPGDGSLLALSDRGQMLRMQIPPARRTAAAIAAVFPGSDEAKPLQDIEAATRNPGDGRIWLGMEGRNAIVRLSSSLTGPEITYPEAMQGWPSNGGPEAIVRLRDGRFIVLGESRLSNGGGAGPGLLFPGDPVDGAEPVPFYFVPPAGYYPTDMAALPDGRVLILLRGIRIGLPPRFAAGLVLADPAGIRAGEPWRWQVITELAGPVPPDNYEGLAITGGEDGGPVTLWIISDDNESVLIQRTLLLRLEWQPTGHAKTRGISARLTNSEN